MLLDLHLSVIITAYTRRPFIKEAVLSALNQTIGKDRYEVIVVKNYEDTETDQWLHCKNVNSITVTDPSLGGKIRVGLEQARGEIISLLEDDDQFLPTKLAQISEIFENRETVYLSHQNIPFYNEVEDISRFIPKMHTTHTWVSDQLLEPKTLNNALKMGMGHYNSCTSIRGEFLEKFSGKLVGYNVSVDYAIFFLSLTASIGLNKKFVLLDAPLTLYRVSLQKEKQTVQELFNSRLPDALRTLEMLKAQVGSPSLAHYLEQAYIRSQLTLRVLQEETKVKRRETLRACNRLLKKPLFRDFLSSTEPNYKFAAAGLASILASKYVKESLMERWEQTYKQ